MIKNYLFCKKELKRSFFFQQRNNLNYSKKIVNTEIFFISNSKLGLNKYIRLLEILLRNQNIDYSILYLPKKQKRITLLKSPHVNKKSKEHFELNTFGVKIILKSSNELINIKKILINRPTNIQLKLIF